MKIEKLTKENISKLSIDELKQKRLIFIQLFDKYAHDKQIDTMGRNEFFIKYQLLLKAMKDKKIVTKTHEIDKALFKKRMYGLDINSFEKIVLEKDYISIDADFVKDIKAKQVDLIMKNEDKAFEIKLTKELNKRIDKKLKYHYGANSIPEYVPLYDLVLVPKNKLQKIIKVASLDYLEGDKGTAVIQLHLFASEEKANKLKLIEKELIKLRNKPDKLMKSIGKEIGKYTAHLDLRFVKVNDKFYEGAVIYINDNFNLNGNQIEWKDTGNLKWISAGSKTIKIIKAGNEGATENDYGVIIQLEKLNFECKEQKSNKKTIIFNGKLLSGNYIFTKDKNWILVKENKTVFKFKKINEEEHIVGGVVYEPYVKDTDDDYSTPLEIYKALKSFMIDGNRTIKIQHKGKSTEIPIVENFWAETDLQKGGKGKENLIKAGTWYMVVYLGGHLDIWEDVKSGKLTGFSMAGFTN